MLAITFSASAELKAWGEAVGLDIDLLCDAERSVAIEYGAAESPDNLQRERGAEGMGRGGRAIDIGAADHQERPKRLSILVGAEGEIRKIYDVSDAEAHPSEVLSDLT